MSPSGPISRARRSELEDVEEYIDTRRARRSQRDLGDHDWDSRRSFASQPSAAGRPVRATASDAAVPRRRRDLMLADFSWSDAPRGRGRGDGSAAGSAAAYAVEPDVRAAPAPEVLTRAWDGALDGHELPANVTSLAERRSVRDEAGAYASDARDDRELGVSLATPRPVGAASPAGALPVADVSASAPASRRTVVITGHGHDRPVSRRGHDARVRRHERSGFKPDRVAMWAVLLGLALLLAAATSSHGAVLQVHHALLHAAGH